MKTPLKRSGPDCACANTDYFSTRLNVCINIVTLNRYVITDSYKGGGGEGGGEERDVAPW